MPNYMLPTISSLAKCRIDRATAHQYREKKSAPTTSSKSNNITSPEERHRKAASTSTQMEDENPTGRTNERRKCNIKREVFAHTAEVEDNEVFKVHQMQNAVAKRENRKHISRGSSHPSYNRQSHDTSQKTLQMRNTDKNIIASITSHDEAKTVESIDIALSQKAATAPDKETAGMFQHHFNKLSPCVEKFSEQRRRSCSKSKIKNNHLVNQTSQTTRRNNISVTKGISTNNRRVNRNYDLHKNKTLSRGALKKNSKHSFREPTSRFFLRKRQNIKSQCHFPSKQKVVGDSTINDLKNVTSETNLGVSGNRPLRSNVPSTTTNNIHRYLDESAFAESKVKHVRKSVSHKSSDLGKLGNANIRSNSLDKLKVFNWLDISSEELPMAATNRPKIKKKPKNRINARKIPNRNEKCTNFPQYAKPSQDITSCEFTPHLPSENQNKLVSKELYSSEFYRSKLRTPECKSLFLTDTRLDKFKDLASKAELHTNRGYKECVFQDVVKAEGDSSLPADEKRSLVSHKAKLRKGLSKTKKKSHKRCKTPANAENADCRGISETESTASHQVLETQTNMLGTKGTVSTTNEPFCMESKTNVTHPDRAAIQSSLTSLSSCLIALRKKRCKKSSKNSAGLPSNARRGKKGHQPKAGMKSALRYIEKVLSDNGKKTSAQTLTKQKQKASVSKNSKSLQARAKAKVKKEKCSTPTSKKKHLMDPRVGLFKNQFKLFAKFGDRRNSGQTLSMTNCIKWLKQAAIIDGRKVTSSDVEIYFIYNIRRKRTLSMMEYIQFLKTLSCEKALNITAMVESLISCGEPAESITDVTIESKFASEEIRQRITKPTTESIFPALFSDFHNIAYRNSPAAKTIMNTMKSGEARERVQTSSSVEQTAFGIPFLTPTSSLPPGHNIAMRFIPDLQVNKMNLLDSSTPVTMQSVPEPAIIYRDFQKVENGEGELNSPRKHSKENLEVSKINQQCSPVTEVVHNGVSSDVEQLNIISEINKQVETLIGKTNDFSGGETE